MKDVIVTSIVLILVATGLGIWAWLGLYSIGADWPVARRPPDRARPLGPRRSKDIKGRPISVDRFASG